MADGQLGDGDAEHAASILQRFSQRIEGLRTTVVRRPGGLRLWHVSAAIIGAALVATGAILLVIPGPGWLVIFLGVSVWATEFSWARSLLSYGQRQVRNWTVWVARQPRWWALTVAMAGLIAIDRRCGCTLSPSHAGRSAGRPARLLCPAFRFSWAQFASEKAEPTRLAGLDTRAAWSWPPKERQAPSGWGRISIPILPGTARSGRPRRSSRRRPWSLWRAALAVFETHRSKWRRPDQSETGSPGNQVITLTRDK